MFLNTPFPGITRAPGITSDSCLGAARMEGLCSRLLSQVIYVAYAVAGLMVGIATVANIDVKVFAWLAAGSADRSLLAKLAWASE